MSSQFATPTGTDDISEVVACIVTLARTRTNTVNISEVTGRIAGRLRGLANTVQVSATTARNRGVVRALGGTADISERVDVGRVELPNEVDISNVVSVVTDFVQFDTWRPIPRGDNQRVLVCRTPQGDHDTDLTGLELWTMRPDGSLERKEIASPADNGFGWDSYAHPEWSPDGEFVVVAAETATEWKLVLLPAAGFGVV